MIAAQLANYKPNNLNIFIRKTNPKFILRNYMAQEVIEAAEESNYLKLEMLIKIITNPFEEHEDFQSFAERSPEWAKDIEISCSS